MRITELIGPEHGLLSAMIDNQWTTPGLTYAFAKGLLGLMKDNAPVLQYMANTRDKWWSLDKYLERIATAKNKEDRGFHRLSTGINLDFMETDPDEPPLCGFINGFLCSPPVLEIKGDVAVPEEFTKPYNPLDGGDEETAGADCPSATTTNTANTATTTNTTNTTTAEDKGVSTSGTAPGGADVPSHPPSETAASESHSVIDKVYGPELPPQTVTHSADSQGDVEAKATVTNGDKDDVPSSRQLFFNEYITFLKSVNLAPYLPEDCEPPFSMTPMPRKSRDDAATGLVSHGSNIRRPQSRDDELDKKRRVSGGRNRAHAHDDSMMSSMMSSVSYESDSSSAGGPTVTFAESSTSKPSDNASEPEWQCQICTCLNPMLFQMCQACDHPRS